MSVIELHPEDLLDKELSGELSPDERDRLEAHITSCSACRFERSARGDFRSEFAAEGERAKRLAGMESLVAREVRSPEAPRRATPPARVRRVRVAVLIAAAFFVFASIGGAAVGWSYLQRAPVESPPPLEIPSAPPVEALPSAKAAPRRALIVDHAPVAPSASASAEPEAVAPSPTQAVIVASAPVAAPASVSARPAVVMPAPAPAPTEVAPPPAPAESASSLFARANDARRHGDYGRAMGMYAELEANYGASAEATAVQAVLGRLLLDRGDAAGALRRFDAYLQRGGGGLREEAMAGRALALQRLGRAGEEVAAWAQLLAAYPSSVHAARARERIGATAGH